MCDHTSVADLTAALNTWVHAVLGGMRSLNLVKPERPYLVPLYSGTVSKSQSPNPNCS